MTALETSWEEGLKLSFEKFDYDNVNGLTGDFKRNNLKNNFLNPAILINTTEINSGRRYIISNIKIDSNYYSTSGDFMSLIGDRSIRYSTAIGISAKFPIVSPAGTFIDCKNNKFQFLDGGYYENKGAQTLYETIKAVMQNSKYKEKIRPIVIQFSFGDKSNNKIQKGVSTSNEILEIINGIYNVRSGHSENASDYLKKYIENLNKGYYFDFSTNFNSHKLPMNWVLSQKAIDSVKYNCQNQKTTIDSIKKILNNNKK